MNVAWWKTIGLMACSCLGAASLRAQDAGTPPARLTNAAQVRSLQASEAAAATAVRLRGVVVDRADPAQRAVIVADQTAGMYVLAANNILAPFRRGDFLEIQGVTDPGQFAPIVLARSVRSLGRTNVPPPQPVTYRQLITGAMDAQWVEFSGVVRRCINPVTNSDLVRISVAADGGVVSVRTALPQSSELQEDAEVRVQAICLYQFNQRRQVLTPVLQVPGGLRVQVTKPAPANPFDAPIRAADSLLHFSPEGATDHRVRVRGVVTHAQPGTQLWIRDQSSGLRIQIRQEEAISAGDEIDVLGFPAYGSSSPRLEDALFRKLGSGKSPVPLPLENARAAFDHEDDLIAIEAQLVEIQPVLEGLSLTLDLAGDIFKAILRAPSNQRPPADWRPGSRVRVTGICSVIYQDAQPIYGMWLPQSFQLLMRSSGDLTVLVPAPWWTPRHTTYALALISALLLLVTSISVMQSRRRLKEQAHRREMAEAEFAAILAERNRVAREIHDTLAQGLTATSVQLRLAKKAAGADQDSLSRHLDSAQGLVSESLEEARNSIWNMRSHVLETHDLAGALKEILKQMTDEMPMQAGLEVTGRARRLSPVIENNVLRVGQEAITNAARHAAARNLKVTLDFGAKQFRLSVQDDGKGFNPEQPPRSQGGFGLVGMKERAAELKGELRITSKAGEGTKLDLIVSMAGA